MKEFFAKFGIHIHDEELFKVALTHNSYANEKHLNYTYQRLEFLGDAVLQLYISKYLYLHMQKNNEGKLTKMRSDIVRETTLSQIAKQIGLGQLLRLGQGEIKSRGYEKPSILADVFESITAAIFLDQSEAVVEKWLHDTLLDFVIHNNLDSLAHDYKSELQEIIQAEVRSDLEYVVEDSKVIEQDNKIEYVVSVNLDGIKYGIGKGFSKQEASQNAAKDCLQKLRKSTK